MCERINFFTFLRAVSDGAAAIWKKLQVLPVVICQFFLFLVFCTCPHLLQVIFHILLPQFELISAYGVSYLNTLLLQSRYLNCRIITPTLLAIIR